LRFINADAFRPVELVKMTTEAVHGGHVDGADGADDRHEFRLIAADCLPGFGNCSGY
jgi:hypothetical protein